jgi:xylulokinase
MTTDALIGVDLGTSSMKAVLVTVDGGAVSRTSCAYPMHSSQPGWNENDPRDWFDAFVAVVATLATNARESDHRVRGIGLVGQRDPFVLLDDDGEPTTSTISWTDMRAQQETEEVRQLLGRDRLVEIAGARPITGLGLGNLLWTRRHRPAEWARTSRVVAPKDYVLGRLSTLAGTDTTSGSRSMAFDIRQLRWSDEILGALELPLDLFAPVAYQPGDKVGELGEEWGKRLGLPADVVIAAGGADDQAAALGAGAIAAGQVCIGTGTCSGWRLVADEFEPDTGGRWDCAPHVVPGRYIREVSIDSTGSSLRWFRDQLCRDLVEPDVRGGGGYPRIIDMAMQVAPGSDGLMFFPYVAGGERAPHYLEFATGVFFGITTFHTRAHMARSILEGIAFQYPGTLAALVTGKQPEGLLRIVDGEAASGEWTQLKADVLGQPIQTMAVLDASALGAAILAGAACGHYPSVVSAAQAMVRYSEVVRPRPAETGRYRVLRARYERAFESIKGAYRPPDDEGAP